jgi:hypothetical protein
MDYWIPLIGSALGGAGLTAIFGIWKDSRDKDSEHARWLRDAKQIAYVKFIDGAQNLIAEAVHKAPRGPERVQWRTDIMLEIRPTVIHVLAPENIRDMTHTVHGGLHWLSVKLSSESFNEPEVMELRQRTVADVAELAELFRKDLKAS